jgi:calnexin
MQNDILFDNIYIGHSIQDAEKLAKETYHKKIALEKAEEEASAPKRSEKKAPGQSTFTEDPITYIRDKIELFVDVAKRDPVRAVKLVPEVAGGLGVLAVTALVLIVSIVTLGSGKAPSKAQVKEQAKKAKDVVVDAKDKAAEAVASGVEKVQGEVEKRTARAE